MAPRSRLPSPPTIWYDPVGGDDNNDGSSATSAFKHLQAALDHACSDVDVAAPFGWVNGGNVGVRTGITIRMVPTSAANAERLAAPAFVDGLSKTCPIRIIGDPNNPADYNIYAANSLQGITSQQGAVLDINGISIAGDRYCTYINGLENGNIRIGNVICHSITGQECPVGAAGKSIVSTYGRVTLTGPGWVSVFTAIEQGMLNFPSARVTIANPMNFGYMINVMRAEAWTQGSPIIWDPLPAGTTGIKYVAYYHAFIGFLTTSGIPGSPGIKDATSVVI